MSKRTLILDNLIENANYLDGVREILKDLGLTDITLRDTREFRNFVGKAPDIVLQAVDSENDYDVTDRVAQCIVDSGKPVTLIGYYHLESIGEIAWLHNDFWKKTRDIKGDNVDLIPKPLSEYGWRDALCKYLSE